MVSLISDLTDGKGRRAPAGWLFFDADCSFCARLVRRAAPTLAARGFGLAPLQSPRVRALLGAGGSDLLREIRLLLPDGSVRGGADALLHLARRVWWAWPLHAFARLPGARGLLVRIYRWVAEHRHCRSTRWGPCDRSKEECP